MRAGEPDPPADVFTLPPMPADVVCRLRDTLYVADVLQQFGEHFLLPHTAGHADLVMLLYGPLGFSELCSETAQHGAAGNGSGSRALVKSERGGAQGSSAAGEALRPCATVAGAAALGSLYSSLLGMLVHDVRLAGVADRLELRWERCLGLDGTWPEVLRRYVMDRAGRAARRPEHATHARARIWRGARACAQLLPLRVARMGYVAVLLGPRAVQAAGDVLVRVPCVLRPLLHDSDWR